MWIFSSTGRRGSAGGPPSPARQPPSLRRKILISGFILFHFGFVAVSVIPGRIPARDALLSCSAPLPARRPDPVTNSLRWGIERLSIISFYLGKTGQWQNWNLFAPNPMASSRYLGGRVTYRSGAWQEITLPRLEQLGYVRAHLEARYREYQYGLSGPLAALEDLARYVARSLNNPANPAVRVDIFVGKLDIPPPPHPGPGAPDSAAHVDYSKLLRDGALYVRHPLLIYTVKPGDLR